MIYEPTNFGWCSTWLHRRRGVCTFLVWCWFLISAQAQIQTNLDLSGIAYPDGVRFIEQESNGFLWLATNRGVLRTDGHRHQWVWSDDHAEVSSLKICNHTIWVGTSTGEVVKIDGATKAVQWRMAMAQSPITCLEEASDGAVYFGTKENGLGWFDGNSTVLLAQSAPDLDLSIHCLQHWNDVLYFATDRGVYILKNRQNPLPLAIDPVGNALADQYVHAMVANEEAIYFAGENGSITRLKKDQNIEQADYFNTWHKTSINHLAIYGNQLLVIDALSKVYSLNCTFMAHITPIEQSTNTQEREAILDIQVNKQGVLMLTYGVSEVYSIDLIQSRLEVHDGVELSNVNTLFLSMDHNFWLANEQGLFMHNADFIDGQVMHQVMTTTNGSHIVALRELTNQRLLVGTFGDGLHLLQRTASGVKQTKIYDDRINSNITSIELLGHQIWVTTLGGLVCLEAEGLQIVGIYDDHSPLGATYLYCAKSGQAKDLWIGTDGKGLIHFKDGEFEHMRNSFPSISKSITAIELDMDGRLWLLSLDQGIQCLYQGGLQEHPKLSNAYLGEIGAMMVLKDRQLLLHSARGIYLYDPIQEVLVLINDERNVLAAGFQTIAIDEERKKVWVARENDLWSCELEAFTQNHKPQLHLDGIQQSLTPVKLGQCVFENNQNHLTFLLSVPWFVPGEFPSIQYRLLGLDSQWIQTQERTLNYPQLAPGKYKLEVMVVMNNETIAGTSVSYEFEILRPYYKRWWFVLLIVVVAIGLIWTLTKWRLKQIHNRTMIRQRQLEGELQVLRSQINPHFLFNSFNTLTYTIEKDPTEAVEYVEQLSDYFRLVLQRTEKTLIPLHEEMTLVNHYIYLQKKRFGNYFQVEMRVSDDYAAWLVPPMVAQIIIENAVKHNVISREKPLVVQLSTDRDKLIIQNNINAMIKKPQGTGTGLYNIQRRIEILTSRDMIVEHGPHQFIVYVPLLDAAKE